MIILNAKLKRPPRAGQLLHTLTPHLEGRTRFVVGVDENVIIVADAATVVEGPTVIDCTRLDTSRGATPALEGLNEQDTHTACKFFVSRYGWDRFDKLAHDVAMDNPRFVLSTRSHAGVACRLYENARRFRYSPSHNRGGG